MAELTYRDAVGSRVATIRASLIGCTGLAMMAAQGQTALFHAQGRPIVKCAAWCNMCQATDAC